MTAWWLESSAYPISGSDVDAITFTNLKKINPGLIWNLARDTQCSEWHESRSKRNSESESQPARHCVSHHIACLSAAQHIRIEQKHVHQTRPDERGMAILSCAR